MLCIYLAFSLDFEFPYSIGYALIPILFISKIPYYHHERKLFLRKIKNTPLLPTNPPSEIDFYKLFKLRIFKKDSKIGIKEKLFPPTLLDINLIDPKTDSIIILKSKWYNWNLRHMGYNTYYQVIYIKKDSATELISLKTMDWDNVESVFDFENFIKLGENFAHTLDLKYKVVTNL